MTILLMSRGFAKVSLEVDRRAPCRISRKSRFLPNTHWEVPNTHWEVPNTHLYVATFNLHLLSLSVGYLCDFFNQKPVERRVFVILALSRRSNSFLVDCYSILFFIHPNLDFGTL
jgi:hypothetical protein